MARGPKAGSGKRRLQQALKQRVARAIENMRSRSPAQHAWLLRHMERQNGRCAYCGIAMVLEPDRGEEDRKATLDHVVPLARHGADSESNTVAACAACNAAKADISAQLFRLSAFVVARKAYAATVPERKAKTLVIEKLRRRPWKDRAP